MTQDTRKDRRVKIVSLNVRYKSATVDEFIDNHAHDVSRGGIYIKTANPFPIGTLLKFEIRLAADQPVIAGVGRVVWKRDTTQGTTDHPSGMGVKFIKVDDPSKVVIDRLVTSRSDAGKAFESEPAASAPARSSQRPADGTGTAAAKSASSPPTVRRKSTPYPGVGAVVSTSSGPRSAAPLVFPRASPDAAGGTKQEPTVMKQAAELLEEALREAGGSMDEVENNPLFAPPKSAKPPALPPEPQAPATDKAALAAPPASPAPAAEKSTAPAAKPVSKDATVARGMVAALSPGPALIAKKAESAKPPAPPPVAPPKTRSRGPWVAIIGIAVVGGVLALVNRDKLFGSNGAEPPAADSAPAVASSAPAVPAPIDSAAAAPAPSAVEATPSAAASSSSPATSSTAAQVVRPIPVAAPTPIVISPPVKATPPAPVAPVVAAPVPAPSKSAPSPAPTGDNTPVASAAPTVSVGVSTGPSPAPTTPKPAPSVTAAPAPSAAASNAAAPAAPKAAPSTPPKKGSDDNPY